MTIELGRDGSTGTVTLKRIHVSFKIVNGVEYIQASARAGAQFLGATIPRALKVGWLELPAVTPALASFGSIERLFNALSHQKATGLTKAGLASVNGRQTIRLNGGTQEHIDVASTGPPLLVDVVLTTRQLRVDFDHWNRPIRITAPTRPADLARLRLRRPTVRTLAPPNLTLVPTPAVGGIRRFRAVGVSVEFDYPADFVPLRVRSTRRAGRLHGADIGVGLGSDLAIIVTQFSGLPVPVTAQNASVLAPTFEREIDALAGRPVPAHIRLLAGHPLFDFGAFASGGNTLKVYNVFYGDAYAELECQYAAPERARGEAACNELIATLRISRG